MAIIRQNSRRKKDAESYATEEGSVSHDGQSDMQNILQLEKEAMGDEN